MVLVFLSYVYICINMPCIVCGWISILVYTYIYIGFSPLTNLCILLLSVQLISCGGIKCSIFFFLSMISLIHSLNVQNKTKSFQNLWHPTYESCQLWLFILKIKLKQKKLFIRWRAYQKRNLPHSCTIPSLPLSKNESSSL